MNKLYYKTNIVIVIIKFIFILYAFGIISVDNFFTYLLQNVG
jgi:hypothetical protein